MQLANWLSTKEIPAPSRFIPSWMELLFGMSPTVEGLVAQLAAAVLVIGSYGVVQFLLRREARRRLSAADGYQLCSN